MVPFWQKSFSMATRKSRCNQNFRTKLASRIRNSRLNIRGPGFERNIYGSGTIRVKFILRERKV
jgi:hypothetical protein